ELAIDHGEARMVEGKAGVGVRVAWRRVRREVDAGAAGQAGDERGRVAQAKGVGQRVAELREVAARRSREYQTVRAADGWRIAGRKRRRAVALGARVESAAEILEASADLELIAQVVEDLAVDAGRGDGPGGRHQTVGQLGTVDAVEQGRLVMLIDVADRHQIDARRPDVEVGRDLEVDPELLDLRGAVKLVVVVEAGPGV